MENSGSHSKEVARRRAQITLSHLLVEPTNDVVFEDCSASSQKKGVNIQQLLDNGMRAGHHQGKEPFKWNGWGYDDCEFKLNEEGHVYLSGKRYDLCGVPFPKLRPWAEKLFSLEFSDVSVPQQKMSGVKPSIRNEDFLRDIQGNYVKMSFEELDRIAHGHGHTCDDIYRLRYGTFERLPDVVIWPGNHNQVEVIVKAAAKHNVVIIPYGGGTSVSNAIECPAKETRMVVSLDMHEMNRIKWIDHESMMACIEAGIIGKDLDEKLARLGLCMGHEPDSSEWSSLGGWISTRASGMKKNVYGNIEDIVINVKIVTPVGTIEKGCNVPRMSTGPDVKEVILGSVVITTNMLSVGLILY